MIDTDTVYITLPLKQEPIEDSFIDVSEEARKEGILYDVIVSDKLWQNYIVPSFEAQVVGETSTSRLYNVLTIFRAKYRYNDEHIIPFRVMFNNGIKLGNTKYVTIWAVEHFRSDDNFEPFVILMLPEEY